MLSKVEPGCAAKHLKISVGVRIGSRTGSRSGEVADWQFDLLVGEDRRRRKRIAEQLARLSPTAQLFAETGAVKAPAFS